MDDAAALKDQLAALITAHREGKSSFSEYLEQSTPIIEQLEALSLPPSSDLGEVLSALAVLVRVAGRNGPQVLRAVAVATVAVRAVVAEWPKIQAAFSEAGQPEGDDADG